jgi:hypothetical protein
MNRPGTQPRARLSPEERRHELSARRRLWAFWAGVAMILVGDFIDLAWHARHGEFKQASDVLHGHWLSWLGLVIVIAVCVAAVRGDHDKSRPGFRWALVASLFYAYGSLWNFWGHVHGTQTFFAHVVLGVSKVAILAAGAATTHLLIGHEEHPGLFKPKKRA